MLWNQKIFRTLLFSFLSLSLAQCSKKTKSQDVAISVTPNQPIVFTTAYQGNRGGSAVTLPGPWFNFSVTINNQTDTALTIIGVHIDIVGVDSNNQPATVSADFTPSQDNVTLNTIACTYLSYGTIAAGATTALAESSLAGCPSGTVFFVASGAPKPTNTALIRYMVTVKPVGYFSKDGQPTDRFDSSTVIYTQ